MVINNQPVQNSNIREQNGITAKQLSDQEPSDKIIFPLSYFADENGIISYSPEKIAEAKGQMEKEGFKFNKEGRASAIISSNGENKLYEAERIVSKYGGKVTGSLWVIDSFTAEITPEAYCFLFEKMPEYVPKPDIYEEVIHPTTTKTNTSRNDALADFADLLGL